jgi:hypothetical protein
MQQPVKHHPPWPGSSGRAVSQALAYETLDLREHSFSRESRGGPQNSDVQIQGRPRASGGAGYRCPRQVPPSLSLLVPSGQMVPDQMT